MVGIIPAGGQTVATSSAETAELTRQSVEDQEEEQRELSYKGKIELVGKLLNVETVITKSSKNFALSAGSEVAGASHSLPPSASFMNCFEKWTDELKGAEGTERAKKRPGEYYDTGTLPKKVKPKMAAYRITDCPWKTAAQSYDRALLESVLVPAKEPHAMKITTESAESAKPAKSAIPAKRAESMSEFRQLSRRE